MKNYVSGLLWGLLAAGSLQAQIVIVRDAETAQPVELVSLSSDDPPAQVMTNAMGEVEISAFKGAGRIFISHLGYLSVVRSYESLQQESFQVWLSPALETLGQVVVSANRWLQPASVQPIRTAVVTARDIAQQNPQTAADLLALSGEVFIQKSQQGGGSPMIRGFATNRLLYVVDGVRMNTAIFRAGNIQNVISLDPFATEQAEMYFGPGSVMYGSDAIGGVMKFNTLRPQFSAGPGQKVSGSVASRYSSANKEQAVHFDVAVSGRKWASVTSFSHHDFDDLRMGRYGPDEYLRPFYVQRVDTTDVLIANDDPLIQRPSGYSQVNLMQKFAWKPGEKWRFDYGFHYSETSDYARYDRHIRYRPNGMPRSGEWNYGPQTWMMNNFSGHYACKTALFDEFEFRVAQQQFGESRIDRGFNDSERRTREERVDALSVNLDWKRGLESGHTFFYGAEMVWNGVTSAGTDTDITTGTSLPGPSRYPQADWLSYGVYVTDHYKVSEKVALQGGVRWNAYEISARFDTTFYPLPFTSAEFSRSALTGSLGLTWTPDRKTTVRVNGATGFRSPNVDDLGKVFDSAPGRVVVPNPDLRAEYVVNGEAGIARIFGDWLSVDLTGYYSRLYHAMVRRDYTLNGLDSLVYDGELSRVQAIQNTASMYVMGIQAGFEMRFLEHFTWLLRMNVQTGEEELDDGTRSPARHAAPAFGTARLRYNSRGLSLEFNAMYSDGRSFEQLPAEEQDKTEIYAVDAEGNPYSPSWYTLSFRASYTIEKRWVLGGGVENLTDQRYRPYSSGMAGAGRNVLLSARVLF
jgi:hemoglobin/transferrin/lactoferrin receptor protein